MSNLLHCLKDFTRFSKAADSPSVSPFTEQSGMLTDKLGRAHRRTLILLSTYQFSKVLTSEMDQNGALDLLSSEEISVLTKLFAVKELADFVD